jgi:putative oxidoreductase
MALQSTIHSMEPYFRSVLRIVAGFTFLCHGVQKLLALKGGAHLPLMADAACFLETVGGLLILIGLFTSPVACVLSGEMAVAYFMVHFPKGFLPIQNGGELAVVYCFLFLYLFAAGAGPLSADCVFRNNGVRV